MSEGEKATYRDPFVVGEDPRRQRGRRTGSRAKLAQRFFEDTYAAWEEQGPSVLARAAFHDPVAFANMVARLMPQKIEVSTPTDGMTDERLAEMLEFAERMAGLKAAQAKVIQGEVLAPAHKLTDENGPEPLCLEGRGGGPLCEEGGGGKNTSSTQRPIRADATETPSNPLNPHSSEAIEPNSSEAIEPNSSKAIDPLVAETPLPYPVGKPFATPDHVVERQNRRAIAEREDNIDPQSLF